MRRAGLRSAAANTSIFIWLAAALAAGCAHPGLSAFPGPSPSPSACGPQDGVGSGRLRRDVGARDRHDRPDVRSDQRLCAGRSIERAVLGRRVHRHGEPGGSSAIRNADEFAPNIILHSAVGLPTPLPTPGYVFPAAAASPVGSAISNSGLWSTGRVQPLCFSQSFSLTAGTYYFGDIDYYGSINMRDVLVVTTSVPPASERRYHRTFLRRPLVTGAAHVLDSARKKD